MDAEPATGSWKHRLRVSFSRILFGILLGIGGLGVLAWNEIRQVSSYLSRHELRNRVVPVRADAVSEVHEGKPVYMTGMLETVSRLEDPTFHIQRTAIALRRTVEMYQRRGTPSSSDAPAPYDAVWSDRLLPPPQGTPAGEAPPPETLPFANWQDRAEVVTLGSFTLSGDLLPLLTFFEPVVPRDAALPDGFRLAGPTLYRGADPDSPEIGDVRIRLEEVKPGPVSVIAGQQGSRLIPWPASSGARVALILPGFLELEDMLDPVRQEAPVQAWTLRISGGLLTAFGMYLVLQSLVDRENRIPLLGSLAGIGPGGTALLMALTGMLLLLSLTWITVRPLVGSLLLVGVAGLTVFHFWRQRHLPESP